MSWRLAPYGRHGEPVVDRLAPDFQNVNVLGSVKSTAVLETGDGEDLTTTNRDGRTGLDVADTDTRRLLEDILILLSAVEENTRR